MNLIRYRAAVGRCQQPLEIPCSLTTRDRKLPCRTLSLLRPILAAFHGSEQTRAECSDFGSFRIPASLAEGLMTTKHSTYVFCNGGDGLTVERRDDDLFLYAVTNWMKPRNAHLCPTNHDNTFQGSFRLETYDGIILSMMCGWRSAIQNTPPKERAS